MGWLTGRTDQQENRESQRGFGRRNDDTETQRESDRYRRSLDQMEDERPVRWGHPAGGRGSR